MNTKNYEIYNEILYHVNDFNSDSIGSQIVNSSNLACFYSKKINLYSNLNSIFMLSLCKDYSFGKGDELPCKDPADIWEEAAL